MTEQEAKTKWCPMVKRVKSEVIDSRNLPYCIASACMMWRWSQKGAWVNGTWTNDYPVEGYCGLAGKP
jgi:hypothetical protein